MYDGVHLIAKALDAVPYLNDVRMTSLSCNKDRVWKHGTSILNFIKTVNVHYITVHTTAVLSVIFNFNVQYGALW